MVMTLDAPEVELRARKIRLLILDVDGVMTDGRLWLLPEGEAKVFYVRDGLGLQLFMAAGGQVAIISGRRSEVVERRAQELGIEWVYQGIDDKVETFDEVLTRLECRPEEVAYIGDDLPDLPLIGRAGLGFAVADAASEVRMGADVVLRNCGGHGAIREACELILKAKGAWQV